MPITTGRLVHVYHSSRNEFPDLWKERIRRPSRTSSGLAGEMKSRGVFNSTFGLLQRGAHNLADSGVHAYMDPGLRCASRRYHRFVRRLYKCGMIDSDGGGDVACEIGLFAVTKKGDKQRLVLDCRTANFYFTDPSATRLHTAAGHSRLTLPPWETLYSEQFDLKNAFYQIGLPRGLRQYLCLPGVRAASVGIQYVGGRRMGPT